MIFSDREEEQEEMRKMEELEKKPVPKPSSIEFKKGKKDMVEFLMLRTRFKDTRDGKVLFKRRDDWIKDLNLNLVRGKVVRSTVYFDELADPQKLQLLRALETEPNNREPHECALIEPYVRSMTFLKPYQEFESSDFLPILQEIKLHKFKAGTRIVNFGEPANSIYIVVNGRIAITHPDEFYIEILAKEGQKGLRDRAQIMTMKQVNKALE